LILLHDVAQAVIDVTSPTQQLFYVRKERDMAAVPNVSDVRSYASDRVFNGTRPLSASRTKRLQARFGQPPVMRRWSVLDRIITVVSALVHAVKF
jgi:hypothetical protein